VLVSSTNTAYLCLPSRFHNDLRVTAVIESLPLRHRYPAARTFQWYFPCVPFSRAGPRSDDYRPEAVRRAGEHSSAVMRSGMAYRTKRNQVLLSVVTGLTAEFLVVDLEVGHRAASLASPTIPPEYLVAELFVRSGIKPQAWLLWPDAIHDAFPAKWSRNVFRSSPGKNLKKRRIDCRRTCELPFSRLAPARKSAQIISRQ
jgi:hypothetical protein